MRWGCEDNVKGIIASQIHSVLDGFVLEFSCVVSYTHLDEHLGVPDLPVVTLPFEHSTADLLGSALEVGNLTHLQSREEDSVALHKLTEGVANGVTSSTDPMQRQLL